MKKKNVLLAIVLGTFLGTAAAFAHDEIVPVGAPSEKIGALCLKVGPYGWSTGISLQVLRDDAQARDLNIKQPLKYDNWGKLIPDLVKERALLEQEIWKDQVERERQDRETESDL